MKILYLSKALVVGAYQTKLEAIARTPGIDLVAAVPPSWKDERGEHLLEVAHTAGYDLRVTPIVLNGWFHTHFYPSIGSLLDSELPDLFHIDEEAYNLATFHAGWMARRRGIPFLFFTWQNLRRQYPPPFAWTEQWVYRNAAHALAGNKDAARVLREKGYRGEITVIPQFGVDPRHFREHDRADHTDELPRIGYAGRLVPEKGLHLLLDALGGLTDLPWCCEIVGSGPERASLERAATRLGLDGRVNFRAPLPSTEMPCFYREIDIFVLPSLSRPNWKEQFGRVLIEAMASEVAVIGSDSGEIPHVVGDAGLIVPEGSAEALREALRQMLVDPSLRRRSGHAGRRRVLERFTQEAIARATTLVYEKVHSRG